MYIPTIWRFGMTIWRTLKHMHIRVPCFSHRRNFHAIFNHFCCFFLFSFVLMWVQMNWCFFCLPLSALKHIIYILVGTRDGRTQSAPACKPALLHLALRTWVSGPRQTHRYRTPKALHPTVVLSFSRHFSLRPVVTDRRTHATSDFIYIYIVVGNVHAPHLHECIPN
jgi:hypothetical protein